MVDKEFNSTPEVAAPIHGEQTREQLEQTFEDGLDTAPAEPVENLAAEAAPSERSVVDATVQEQVVTPAPTAEALDSQALPPDRAKKVTEMILNGEDYEGIVANLLEQSKN